MKLCSPFNDAVPSSIGDVPVLCELCRAPPEGISDNEQKGDTSNQTHHHNDTLTSQDAATQHAVHRGKGNLPVIADPQVAWPSGIDTFDPTAKEDINKTVAPMSGSKKFDFVFT